MGGRERAGAPLRVVRESFVPPRRQIALRLEGDILDGEYAAGERLPSVRTLGASYGVHRDTAAAAYRELGRRGLVRTVPGSGIFVARRSGPVQRLLEGPPDGLAARVASLAAALRLRRLLLVSDERPLSDVVGAELAQQLPGVRLRVVPAEPGPLPGVDFGWLPVRLLASHDVRAGHAASSGAPATRIDSAALRPLPLPVGLHGALLEALAVLEYPSVVGVLSASSTVRLLAREAVAALAGRDVGFVAAAAGEGPGMRRLRARATILIVDALHAAGRPGRERAAAARGVPVAPGIPAAPGVLPLRLVPARVAAELVQLIGGNGTGGGRTE